MAAKANLIGRTVDDQIAHAQDGHRGGGVGLAEGGCGRELLQPFQPDLQGLEKSGLFPLPAGLGQRAPDDIADGVGLGRLQQIFKGTFPDGGDGRLQGPVAGQHNHGNVGPLRLDNGQQFGAGHPRHANVEHGHFDRMSGQQRQGGGGRGRVAHVVTVFDQDRLQALANVGFVVDEQDASRCCLIVDHHLPSTALSGRRAGSR